MKKHISICLITITLLLFLSIITTTASEAVNVKDYIKGKFPVIFNIYLASLDDLDEDEKEFIDLLEELSEEEQILFAKKVHESGFSKDIIDEIKRTLSEPSLDIEPEKERVEIDTGKWTYKKKTDPINDDVIIYFLLESDSYSARYSDYASLFLRWTEGRTELYINWDNYLSSEGIKVVYRIGEQKAFSSTWAISTSGRATFYGRYGSTYSSKKNNQAHQSIIRSGHFCGKGRTLWGKSANCCI